MATQRHDRRRSYLIQDPYDDDAITFIRSIFTTFGLRPVCCYTDRKARFYGEQQFPVLRSPMIEAAYDVDLSDPAAAMAPIVDRYRIEAIVPYREDTVEVAARLLPHLPIDWYDADLVALMRNKHAMKQRIGDVDPTVRVPAHRLVRSVDDVVDPAPPRRFVLKPNDGMGSHGLKFFAADDRAGVADHLTSEVPSHGWIMEEFIDGPEYRVNGLVRHDGTVQTLLISEYLPERVDEHFTLAYAADTTLASTDPVFVELRSYAERLIAALGLRGMPFHMEVRIDDRGPAMVDLGARVASEATGHLLSHLHPQRPDMYSVAARDYFGPNDVALDPVDYTYYDSVTVTTVTGMTELAGIVESIDGLDEVEALPEFVSWSVKPRVGDVLRPMTELRASPYGLTLRHAGGRERSIELAAEVRRTIRFNERRSPAGRVGGAASHYGGRLVRKGRWMLHRAGITAAGR